MSETRPDISSIPPLPLEDFLDALRRGGIPVGSSCDGDLICGYCRLRILAGAAHLSPVEGEERRLLLRKGADPDERIACAARIQGPVTLTADYW